MHRNPKQEAQMSSHDPFSPASAAAPPTDDIAPQGAVTKPDLTVLQQDETAPVAAQTDAAQETTNDAQTATSGAETPAEGGQAPAPELEVKSGTSKEVMDWVHEAKGDDRKARAQAALNVERASSEPRKGLSRDLEELLGGNHS